MYVEAFFFFLRSIAKRRYDEAHSRCAHTHTHTLTQLLLVEFVVMWVGDSHTFCFISNSLSKKKQKKKETTSARRYQVFFPPH